MDIDRLTADYRALSTAAGVVDLTDRRSRLEVRGADRTAFVNNFCTNDVKGLPDGGACEAFLLNGKGNVLFYANIWKRPESIVIESGVDRNAAIIRHLDKYVIREDVTFADRSAGWSELLVAGPQAATHVGEVGETLIVRQGSWTAAPNFIVVGPTADVQTFQQRLVAANVPTCDYAALDALRIEAGFPLDGVDVGDKNLAQEVDRVAQTVSFKKGCYLGQETVARLDALGHVNKSLVGLRFTECNTEQPPPAGTELTAAGRTVGEVTSSAYSPEAANFRALGYVRTGSNAVGTKLDSTCGPVEVVAFQRIS